MKLRQPMFAVAAAIAIAPAPAHAISILWSANATSCVADAASIEFNRYTTTVARVTHRANNVDQIQLNCAISDPLSLSGSQWALALTYRDSTGASTSAFARAQLVRISRVTGNTATVATFNSNSKTATGIVKNSTLFDHAFNFQNSYYFVQIVLDRTSAGEIVEAFGVALEPKAP